MHASPAALAVLIVAAFPAAAAQLSQQQLDERTSLLAFKASGDPLSFLSGWVPAGGAPCAGDSWASVSGGWYGLLCDAAGGRVIYASLSLGHDNGLGGDVSELAPALGELRLLDLSYQLLVHGDVGVLAALPQLRYLHLAFTDISGALGQLAVLPNLGASWSAPDGVTYSGGPHLAGTLVFGDVAPLRALPGLGSWGGVVTHWTPCAAFGAVCVARGLALAAVGADFSGSDDCACCDASPLARDASTGLCTDAQCDGVECGGGGDCYRGACACYAGYEGALCESHVGSADGDALLAFRGGGDRHNTTFSWRNSSDADGKSTHSHHDNLLSGIVLRDCL